MTDNSLLLLAVKRSLNMGRGALQGGNSFASLYGISELEVAHVNINYMNDYIDVLVDECMEKLPTTLQQFKSTIVENLRDSQTFESYAFGEESTLVTNTFYDNNVGKFALFVYDFIPLNQDEIDTETLSVDLSFRLADIAVLITKSKKKLFGGSRTWQEVRYIKPAVTYVDFVNALAIVLAPLLDSSLGINTPDGLTTELKAQAALVPDTMPSDTKRRTVFNPMTQMSVVVTDEAVLKLLPGKWEYVSSEQVLGQAAATNSGISKWEFDQ